MTFGLRSALVEVGIARPSEPLHEISIEDVRSGVRGSCRVASGYIWLEGSPAGTERPSERLFDAIRALVEQDPLLRTLASIPRLTSSSLAVYGPLTSPKMMIEALVPDLSGSHPRWPVLSQDCAALGRFLARLHDASSSDASASALLRQDPALERIAQLVMRGRGAPPSSLPVERLQEHLIAVHPGLAAGLAQLCSDHGATTRSVPLHGRFSPGFVVRDSAAGRGTLHVIGWLSAGYGPAAWDVGWFLGELHEVATAWRDLEPARSGLLHEGGLTFLRTYLQERGTPIGEGFYDDLGRYSALRIVYRLWESATFVAYESSVFELMLNAAAAAFERSWLDVLAGRAAA